MNTPNISQLLDSVKHITNVNFDEPIISVYKNGRIRSITFDKEYRNNIFGPIEMLFHNEKNPKDEYRLKMLTYMEDTAEYNKNGSPGYISYFKNGNISSVSFFRSDQHDTKNYTREKIFHQNGWLLYTVQIINGMTETILEPNVGYNRAGNYYFLN